MIQSDTLPDKMENVARAARFIQEAKERGAELAILPEMFCCPYTNECFAPYAEPAGGPVYTAMASAARENAIILVAGSMPEIDAGKIYNTSFVFDQQGRQIARHRKMHLFDINVKGGQSFQESRTFSAGSEVTLFDTSLGRFGLCICFDIRFPEIFRLMALEGAQAIFVPAAFNMTTGPAHWELAFRQRAVDAQLFTLGCSPARDEKGPYVAYGNSIVCSPWGDVIARAGTAESMLLADINLADNQSIREQLPLLSARREDVYKVERA